MSHAATYETLIQLYQKSLDYTERAKAEALTADNALENGNSLKAKQHFEFARDYRQKAKETLILFHNKLESMPNQQATYKAILSELKQKYPESFAKKDLAW